MESGNEITQKHNEIRKKTPPALVEALDSW